MLLTRLLLPKFTMKKRHKRLRKKSLITLKRLRKKSLTILKRLRKKSLTILKRPRKTNKKD